LDYNAGRVNAKRYGMAPTVERYDHRQAERVLGQEPDSLPILSKLQKTDG
jgi:hypothetical protein